MASLSAPTEARRISANVGCRESTNRFMQKTARRTCVNTSFVSRPHSDWSNALSKLSSPLLPFRQLPVIFSSSMVWTFCTCILILGPLGVFAAHM